MSETSPKSYTCPYANEVNHEIKLVSRGAWCETCKIDAIEAAPAELEIRSVCDGLAEFLVEKNRKYGNSALEPVRIASKASSVEQILVRIDDKLCRWKNRQADDDEDIEHDLLGYLVLLRIARQRSRK